MTDKVVFLAYRTDKATTDGKEVLACARGARTRHGLWCTTTRAAVSAPCVYGMRYGWRDVWMGEQGVSMADGNITVTVHVRHEYVPEVRALEAKLQRRENRKRGPATPNV